MRHYTEEELDCLSRDENVRRRITQFLFADKAAFFEEVRSHLSPQELEEYLEENPSQRKYMTEEKEVRQ